MILILSSEKSVGLQNGWRLKNNEILETLILNNNKYLVIIINNQLVVSELDSRIFDIGQCLPLRSGNVGCHLKKNLTDQ